MGTTTFLKKLNKVKTEDRAIELYSKDGWSALKNGWPDLLLYKIENNKLLAKFVEVKSRFDKLSRRQKKMLTVLHKLGLDVSILLIDNNKEIPGCEDPRECILPEVSLTEEELHSKFKKFKRYEKTEDGGLKVPVPLRSICRGGSHKGYRLLYPCPVCGIFRRADKRICHVCLKKSGIDPILGDKYSPDDVKKLLEKHYGSYSFKKRIQ